jgi:carbon storage regulator
MLLLTRRRGEGFQIGEGIHIKVISVIQGNVTIGINAPKDQYIARDEVVGKERLGKDRNAQDPATEILAEVSHAPMDP